MDSLLKLIKKDASLTPSQLADLLGMSVGDVEAKIEKYKKDGVILGSQTLIHPDHYSDETVTAAIEVKLTPEREGGFNRYAARIANFDQVQACYLMSGAYDLLVIIEGRSLQEVASFVAEKLSTLEGVVSTATHFILKPYKENGVLLSSPARPERLAVTP
jgi:DNA-binding Lrp family transcriptional regulator